MGPEVVFLKVSEKLEGGVQAAGRREHMEGRNERQLQPRQLQPRQQSGARSPAHPSMVQ
jgi:hypothetical protein